MANNYNQATVFPELPASLFSKSEIESLCACGFSCEANGGTLYFFAEECFCEVGEDQDMKQIDCTKLLQGKLQHLDAALYPYIVIEGAVTCSKMRPGEFGGFVYFITREEVRYASTGSWIVEQESAWKEGTSVDRPIPVVAGQSQKGSTIVIEVRGGCVVDVQNTPPDCEYEIRDYDNEEVQEDVRVRE